MMDTAAKKRWALLLTALVVTVGAIAYPVDEFDVVEVVVPAAQAPRAQPSRAAEPVAVELSWVASDEDPFAQRAWAQPPPPAPEPAKVVVNVAADAPPPPPPPLPYKFVGQMNNGNERVVYLSRGEQVHLAQQGDLLDGNYKVVSIGATQIEFEAVSSGLRQTLAIPAQDN